MRELRSMLLASSIIASSFAASPAKAAIVPSLADFQLFETRLDATTGQYTLINNSSGWYIHEFFVTNPQAGTPSVEPATTQSNWNASATDNCFGGFSCFTYSNSAGLSSDIGPNTSSDQFFWSSPNPILASDYQLGVFNGDGDPGVVTGTAQDLAEAIPEPTSWSILIAGLALSAWRDGGIVLGQHEVSRCDTEP